MRIGLAQIRPTLGCIETNLAIHKEMIHQAKEQQVELLVFPELSLTGYNLLDQTFDVARSVKSREIKELIEMAQGMDIVFGFVESSHDHIIFNSAVYASNQAIRHLHRKVYLPTYGMFDEARYFGKGDQFASFATNRGQMGMLVCEDIWHPSSAYILAQDGAKMILVLSNSPARGIAAAELQTQSTWLSVLRYQAISYGMYILYANRVGTEDGITFSGGSVVVNPVGEIEAQANLFAQELLVADLDCEAIRRARFQMPILRDEDLSLTIRELQRIEQQKRRWKNGE